MVRYTLRRVSKSNIKPKIIIDSGSIEEVFEKIKSSEVEESDIVGYYIQKEYIKI